MEDDARRSQDVGESMSLRARSAAGICLITLVLSANPAQASWFDRSETVRAQAAQPVPIRAIHAATRSEHNAKRRETEIGKLLMPNGPLLIIVSIANQRVSLFSDGKRVGEASVSTGVAGHPTPMGVFAVISKSRYHQSNIYSGASMPYMHRITWSGIALHEGPLPGHAASHGCIRLPSGFAASLFKISKLGARVIITRDPVSPVEFESARLFIPKKPDEKLADSPIAAAPAKPVDAADARPAVARNIKLEIKASDITGSVVEPVAPADIVKLPQGKASAATPEAATPVVTPAKRKGPVQVFVSRRDGKLYVRQDFSPLFDAAVTIADPDKPWGTHVFTAMDIRNDRARWTSVTIPSGFASKTGQDRRGRKLSPKEIERLARRTFDLAHAPSAAEALERFEMPKDAVERISELLTPGSSLIVSDNALSDETGSETDFIVTTQ